MLYIHPDLFKRQQELDREEAMRCADQWRSVQEACAGERSWLYRLGCKLLCYLGHRMVALGQRLQQYGGPEIVAAEG